MGLLVTVVGIVWRGPSALGLVVQIAVGIISFGAICMTLRVDAFREGRKMVVERIQAMRLARSPR